MLPMKWNSLCRLKQRSLGKVESIGILLNGAFVDAHPVHKSIGIGQDRGLREILVNGKVVKTKQFYNQ